MKTIVILADGMRPDAIADHPITKELLKKSSYALNAQTVMPSVTLPCHMSLFHSVDPSRHGITTNLYMPQVRPIKGLFEQIAAAKGVSAMYYGWEPLRDVSRPDSLKYAGYLNAYAEDATDGGLTDMAIARIQKSHPDFVVLYMVETDEKGGHDSGWMTPTYLDYVRAALENVKRVMEAAPEYTVIVTADHGGHARTHGTEMPEDMTIPVAFYGPQWEKGKALEQIRLLDIAPTIADMMGCEIPADWDGVSLLKK